VVSEGELESAPYVVESADEHLVAGAGNRIYVRGITDTTSSRYNLYRPGDKLIDPDTQEMLGIQAIYLGESTVQKFGEPATLLLERTTREIGIGDRLKPSARMRSMPVSYRIRRPLILKAGSWEYSMA